MAQEMEMGTSDRLSLIFENICDDGDYCWFTAYDFNSLFKMNKITMTAEHVAFIPNESMYQNRGFIHILVNEDQVILIPNSAGSIYIYSKSDGRFESINISDAVNEKIGDTKLTYNDFHKFSKGFINDNNLYLVPLTYPGIISYNLLNGEISVISNWINEIEKHITEPDTMYFTDGLIRGNRLFLPCYSINAILIYCIENNSYEFIKINNSNIGYKSICFDGKDYWLLPSYRGLIVRWNYDEGIIGEYKENDDDKKGDTYVPYVGINNIEDDIYILPAVRDNTIKISIVNSEVSRIDAIEEECNEEYISTQHKSISTHKLKFISQKCIDKKIYAYSTITNRLIIYSPDKNGIIRVAVTATPEDTCNIRKEFIHEYCREQHQDGIVPMQEYFVSLDYFLDFVIGNCKQSNNKSKFCGSGKAIYNTIREVLT